MTASRYSTKQEWCKYKSVNCKSDYNNNANKSVAWPLFHVSRNSDMKTPLLHFWSTESETPYKLPADQIATVFTFFFSQTSAFAIETCILLIPILISLQWIVQPYSGPTYFTPLCVETESSTNRSIFFPPPSFQLALLKHDSCCAHLEPHLVQCDTFLRMKKSVPSLWPSFQSMSCNYLGRLMASGLMPLHVSWFNLLYYVFVICHH